MSKFRLSVFALLATSIVASRAAVAVEPAAKIEYAITLHGGAGIEPAKLSETERQQQRDSLAKALEVGRRILAGGGTSLDAVEQTIRVLEDDPLFNAGRGAVFNSEGKHELDAAIMDGKNQAAGAVTGVMTVKNPISLARLVMTETRHVLLAGEGAEKFADEMRDKPLIERVPNTYFDTEPRRQEWLKAVAAEKKRQTPQPHRGTVGCVALDKHGDLAAGTSTGGLTNKKWGRVGDTPIVGAGTYANNATCAVSCTGTGELFIRNSVAFHVSALIAYKGLSLDAATREIIENVLPPDAGGLIGLDRQGHVSMRFSTPGMARAVADSTGRLEIELGK